MCIMICIKVSLWFCNRLELSLCLKFRKLCLWSRLCKIWKSSLLNLLSHKYGTVRTNWISYYGFYISTWSSWFFGPLCMFVVCLDNNRLINKLLYLKTLNVYSLRVWIEFLYYVCIPVILCKYVFERDNSLYTKR